MEYGVAFFQTANAIAPSDLGPALEERGFESIWLAEHTHIPANRRSPWPGGAELPWMYYETLDPFVTLSVIAACTTTLKLATGICLVVERDPIVTAGAVASLDVLSNGRFLFGVGAGWNAEEMANHGTDFERRWKVLRERIEAMKSIWASEPAEYHGEFVDFDPIHQLPKPIQTPHPPIHVGGVHPGALRRALRYGNGWIPILGRGPGLADAMASLADEAAAAGRHPDDTEVSVCYAPASPSGLAELEELGVQRAVFGLPSLPRDEALAKLDEFAALMPAP